MKQLFVLMILAAIAFPGFCYADETKLQPGDFVAIIGDSITEQRFYSVFMEDYLLMCKPATDLRTMQFGWGGETSGGFSARMKNDMLRYPATVATVYFGMNDGGYRKQTPEQHTQYYLNQTRVVKALKHAGVRSIVLGAPAADSFWCGGGLGVVYNQTLADESDICKQIADEQHVTFVDVHGLMMDVMKKAKAKYGPKYPVAGGDGIHPNENGHMITTYAFLKALGCDGDIGTITVDLAAGTAKASDGHKILSMNDGVVTVESTRYPFCFSGKPELVTSTSGIIEFFPFNQDLNRFQLVVTGAKSARLKVTWGRQSKIFSSDDLAKGINLAAEFIDSPFAGNFAQVDSAVRAQQNFETPMIKTLIHDLPQIEKLLPEEKDELEKIAAAASAKDKILSDAATAAVVPVKHTITIEAAP